MESNSNPTKYNGYKSGLEDGQYLIPANRMDEFQDKLEKLNKRAHKLGCEPITMTPLEAIKLVVKEVRLVAGGPLTPVFGDFWVVTVGGNAPKLNGWAFRGTLQHEEAGNVLRMINNVAPPMQFRTLTQQCDHCGYDRKRNDTYLVQSDAGEWKQIGRSCLRDFLGHVSPEAVAEWASLLANLEGYFGSMAPDEGSSSNPYSFDLRTVLAAVRTEARQHGYMSRKRASDIGEQTGNYPCTTAHTVWSYLTPSNTEQRNRAEAFFATQLEQDALDAASAIDWATNLPADVSNDYLWNVRVIALGGYVTYRELGLAASIVAAWTREQERKQEESYKRTTQVSEHVGEVGKRMEMVLTVDMVRVLPGEIYTSTLIKFLDDAGRSITWFASGCKDNEFTVGDRIKAKATVKKHEEYKGWKTTQVQRVSVLTLGVATAQAVLSL